MPITLAPMDTLIGPLAALSAALFWALSTLLYNQAGSFLSAAQLNLVKGVVACPLLFVSGWLAGSLSAFDGSQAAWILLASGVIGIALGDTLYFAALRRLGPWHTMLLEYLAPPLAAFIAWWALHETMSVWQIIGVVVTISGILLVLSEKRRAADAHTRLNLSGIGAAIGAALCQAVGLVMSFHALTQFEINPLNAALLRIFAGTVALFIALLLLKPSIIRSTRSALRHTSIPWLLAAVVMGAFLGIWLQQIAISSVSPGIAQTLLSTAPLWLIPVQWLRKQALSWQSISGALVALAGIVLLVN